MYFSFLLGPLNHHVLFIRADFFMFLSMHSLLLLLGHICLAANDKCSYKWERSSAGHRIALAGWEGTCDCTYLNLSWGEMGECIGLLFCKKQFYCEVHSCLARPPETENAWLRFRMT